MENEKNTSNFKIIPSVKEVKYLKKAIQSDNLCIQLTGVHIGNLQQLSHICHQAGKTVIVNHELVDGLGKDRIAFQMLKKLYHVDGIIGSSITKLHMMKGLNVKVIYRITLMDSISVDNALKTINEVKFDAIELRDSPCMITIQTRLPFSSFALICVLLWTCRIASRLSKVGLMLKKLKFPIFSRWQRP